MPLKVGDRVIITYPAHKGESGVVETIVPKRNEPALLRVKLDSGRVFLCDERMANAPTEKE